MTYTECLTAQEMKSLLETRVVLTFGCFGEWVSEEGSDRFTSEAFPHVFVKPHAPGGWWHARAEFEGATQGATCEGGGEAVLSALLGALPRLRHRVAAQMADLEERMHMRIFRALEATR